jgi:hypothetical protein
LSFSAFSASLTNKVYRYREHRILNLVTVVFLEEALDLEEVVEWGLALRVVFLIRAAVGSSGGICWAFGDVDGHLK